MRKLSSRRVKNLLKMMTVPVLLVCAACVPMKVHHYEYQPVPIDVAPDMKVEVHLVPSPGTADSSRIVRNPYNLLLWVRGPQERQARSSFRTVTLRAVDDTVALVTDPPPLSPSSADTGVWVTGLTGLQLRDVDYEVRAVLEWHENDAVRNQEVFASLTRAYRTRWIFLPWAMFTGP
jgi:hypothetical protein